jgi:ABC-type transport system involved in Fe-S cluster assembly fused permease/ATPase subunit
MTMSRIRRTEPPASDRDDIRTLHTLWPYLWEYRGRVSIALGFLIVSKLANVGVPLALKGIVDALDTDGQEALMLPLALLAGYGLLRFFASAFNELRDALFARVRYGAMGRASIKVFRHLHRLGLRFHLERRTGGIARDIERGTRSVGSLINYMVFSILPTLVEVGLVIGILLLNYRPAFAAVTLGSVALYVVFTMRVTQWRMPFRHRANALDSRANTRAIDALINYETVKYFGNEEYEAQRYRDSLHQWEDAAVLSQTSMGLLNVGQAGIIALGVTLVMIMAAQGVVTGEMSLGDLVLVNTFLIQLFIPLNFLGVVYNQLRHALADMAQMFDLLQREPEVRDRAGAPALRVKRGEIRFEAVRFGYTPERSILRGVSFVLPGGSKLAVVGPSGAGKSTLARLLYRFYDVQGGAIRIDGQDLREVGQDSLRAAIGIVPQDTVLFNDSIYFNIVYAKPDASREAVERAARLAHLHDFIQALPEGWETLVGERGLKLSGGEKQRVAIARAILKDPPILIFDEATSSLDSHSEQQIQQALEGVARHHTTLVIAHRLSTIVDADQILVMEQGRVVERGSHRELLAQDGLYTHLWTLQQEERSFEELERRVLIDE